MPSINGNPYIGPMNVNLRDGILRFAISHSTNPLANDADGYGLYVDSNGDLTFWDKSDTQIIATGDAAAAPSSSTAPASPTVGDAYYDTTLDKYRVYQDAGWANVDGTSAGTLDNAYNGGQSIDLDGGAVALTDTQTSSANALLITKSGVIGSSTNTSMFHINSTGAHSTSGLVKCMEISVGSETATLIYGIEIAMYEQTDDALHITKGSIELDDGDLFLDATGDTAACGFSVTTANTTGDGIIFNIDSITGGDGFVIDGDATGGAVNYFTVQEGESDLLTVTDDDFYTVLPVEIDVDNEDAFLVTEDGDTEVFSIDTTNDAGDTTFSLTSTTTTGVGVHISVGTTTSASGSTGAGLLIDADAVTTGDALRISIHSGNMGASGAAISVIDSANADREVFAVREDGRVYVYGASEGTTVMNVVAGDFVITDGDLTMSGGEFALTGGTTTTGADLTITSSMTTAGVGAGAAGAFIITAQSATTGTVMAVIADAVTTGDILFIDSSGLTEGSGFFINCNDSNTSKFTVGKYGEVDIAGKAAGDEALTLALGDLVITDTDATTITSVDGTGSIVEIISGGTLSTGKAALEIDVAGAPHANAAAFRISFDGITDTNKPYAMVIDANGVDAGGFYIDSDAETDSACHIHCGGDVKNNMAVLELTWDGTPNNAGTNMLRVDGSGGTNTVKPVLVEILDTGVAVGLTVTTQSIEDMVVFTGAGVTGTGKAVLAVTSTATVADGSFYVDITSGAAGASSTISYLLHVDASHDNLEGIHVAAGKSLFAEAVTFTAGQQSGAIGRTAGDGTGTALIADGTTYVDVTGGANEDVWLQLPSPVTGNVVWLGPSACGYELRSDAPKTVAINGGTQTDAESHILTQAMVRCVCTSALTWICSEFASDGTEAKVDAAQT